jgi:diaminopimelate decarboxylase
MTARVHHFPVGYGVRDGVLTVAGKRVDHWAAEIGETPFFLYDRSLIEQRVRETRAALPADVCLHYAMKANPMPAVVQLMAGLTDGLDVASGGELTRALGLGLNPTTISFAGPGKRDAELALAITSGATLNVESETEVERAGRIARSLGMKANIAVRVNPAFEIRGAGMRMGGKPQPFGIDEAHVPPVLARLASDEFNFTGFHVYGGSQNLSADLVLESQGQTIDMILRLSAAAPRPPQHINLGGGFGIPYFPGDTPLDISRVGTGLDQHLVRARAALPGSTFILELGRYLVGEAGVYITRIIDRKISHGETFLITDGGLHHQLAASGNFGQVIRRNYPVAVATNMVAGADEMVTVVGCLCTPLDRLAEKIPLPVANSGDLICVFQAGAYGLTASPTGFLSHPVASEHLVPR